MQKNTKKIDEKTILIACSLLILLVVLVTILRSMDFSFLKGKNGPTAIPPTEQATIAGKTDYAVISASDLQKKTLSGKKVLLLDIRPFDSYVQEHIVDSVNVSLSEFPLDQKYGKDHEVVVIHDTLDSPEINAAVEKLREENFGNVRVLAGGLSQWKNLAGATVTYGDPNSASDQAKVRYTTTDKVKVAIENNTPFFLVDVRDNTDYVKSHIKNAVNIPFGDLEKQRFQINTSSNNVIFVGINELQEFQAAVQIHDMLLTKTFVMKGAMPEWEKNNFPLELSN